MSNSKLNSSVMILCWWLPKPARGRCALNSPPHPLPRERPLARSLGRETQRLQSHPEGPCVVTVCCWIILEKHSSICQTYLSNWSPFRGEIPRSDGLIWLKNWLRLIPGTRFGHFSKIFNIPDRSQSALLSAVNKCLLIFSISPKLHICSTHESYKNVDHAKFLIKIIGQEAKYWIKLFGQKAKYWISPKSVWLSPSSQPSKQPTWVASDHYFHCIRLSDYIK